MANRFDLVAMLDEVQDELLVKAASEPQTTLVQHATSLMTGLMKRLVAQLETDLARIDEELLSLKFFDPAGVRSQVSKIEQRQSAMAKEVAALARKRT